jgi:hypothetical protein
MNNTPQQDYVWEMGRNCENKFTDLRMERVDSMGRYWVRGNNATSATPYFECMKDQFKAHPFPDWLKAQKEEMH